MLARCVLRARARLAEGPRWDARSGRLLWVDIDAGEVHRFDPESGRDERLCLGRKVGCVAPVDDGLLLAALADEIVLVEDGIVRSVAPVGHPRPGMRTNDGAVDPLGRFWVGTMAEDETPGVAALYRLEPDGALRPVIEDVTLSNGLGWSPDGSRMYYVDSPTRRIDLFDFDGEPSNRRAFAEVPDATPDGLAVDDEGGVWVALWGGGRVRRFAPDGTVAGEVRVPAEFVTACCFRGNVLYITTAQPDGSIYAAEVDVTGPAATAARAGSLPPRRS